MSERIVVVIDLGEKDADAIAEIEAEMASMRDDIPDPRVQSITIMRGRAAVRVMRATRGPL